VRTTVPSMPIRLLPDASWRVGRRAAPALRRATYATT
jgi:hypothetical protein